MSHSAINIRQMKATPRDLGFCMPAEWDRHEAIWLSWPHDKTTFSRLDRVETAYVHMISAIHATEEVRLLVTDKMMKDRVAHHLKKAGADLARVRFLLAKYADVWFRDYGPTFVLNRESGHKAMIHWIFNAWGRKYKELEGDARVPEFMLREYPVRTFRPDIVMEGGSFDVNGRGTLLATEQCLLNKNRNPQLDRKGIEKVLGDYLGADHVIWLKNGVTGDDTDGHVDDIARFVAKDTVLCAYEDDEHDPNYVPLQENYKRLREAQDQDGHRLKVVKLPMPGPVEDQKGRLPASYANFYIGNETVLIPTFDQPSDAKAVEIIQRCFPDKKAVGIDCRDIVHGLGAIHCVSQQEPAL